MIQLEATEPITQQASKPCPICGALFLKRNHEAASRFATRQTCGKGYCLSQIVRQKMLARHPVAQLAESRYCTICNGELARGKTEGWAQFAKRATCGHRCAGQIKHNALSIVGKSISRPVPTKNQWKWIYKSPTFEGCVHHFKLVKDKTRRNWEIGTCQKCDSIRDWPPAA